MATQISTPLFTVTGALGPTSVRKDTAASNLLCVSAETTVLDTELWLLDGPRGNGVLKVWASNKERS